ncbi:MAG TPA: hypothetical protein VML50_17445 [Anaeromyxobacter sp.]|nr:hypothetical protein [Anaeromyxobacter sp.]
MRCTPPPGALPRARGSVNWVTLLMVSVLVGGGYLGWVYVPLYLAHFEVKQVVREYMNQAIKDPNDDRLRDNMVAKLKILDTVVVTGQDGKPEKVPAVDVRAEDVVWEREPDATPPTLRVAFQYVRTVEFPFLDRRTEKVFTIDLTQDVSVPNWAPAR